MSEEIDNSLPPSSSSSSSSSSLPSSIPLISTPKKPFWSQKNIIYAIGFPFISTINEIKNFFSNCGEILSITRQLNDNLQWNGCIFIKFQTKQNMKLALTLDGTIWTGSGTDGQRYIKVKEHKGKEKKKKKKEDILTIFISNLPKEEITNNQINEIFHSCGEIKSIRLAKDSSNKCRGFGHIEFYNKETRNKALELNNTVQINNNYLLIRLATVTSLTEQKKKKKREEAKKLKEKERKDKKKKRQNNNSNNGSSSSGDNNNSQHIEEGKKRKKVRREESKSI